MTVELVNVMGDDLTVVNAARVSYNKESQWQEHTCEEHMFHVEAGCEGCAWVLCEKDAGLIKYLARNRHGSPFEHVVFTFRVDTPIFVAREWFRHRIGSFNEVSGRYTELTESFYVPRGEDVRQQVGKPGNYSFEPVDESTRKAALEIIERAGQDSFHEYQLLLELGIAKELARTVLPAGTYTQFFWTVNLRSLTNFLSLRTGKSALLEIRQEAETVEELITPIVPVCMEAFREGGRQPL